MSRWIAEAPNAGVEFRPEEDPVPPTIEGIAGVARRVAVRDPAASILVWSYEPEDSRGVVLLIHGIRDNRRGMLGVARSVLRAGYTTILPDLRGHGRSSGDWLTYGVVEARDLVAVLDDLGVGRLGVFGFSYGAATAIRLGSIDPRVGAVVAVAPFAGLRGVVFEYAGRTLFTSWIPDSWVTDATDRAGELAGFDPDDASAVSDIGECRGPVLLVHGRADRQISPDNSRAIHAAAPETTSLRIEEGRDHLAMLDPALYDRYVDWFEQKLR